MKGLAERGLAATRKPNALIREVLALDVSYLAADYELQLQSTLARARS